MTSALRMGPVRLSHNNRYINYTKGASPDNSLLECVHHLDEEEQVATVSWKLWDTEKVVGSFEWHSADPTAGRHSIDAFMCESNGLVIAPYSSTF